MEAGGYAANGGRYAHYHRLVWWVHADSPAFTTTNLGTLAAALHSARCHTAEPVGVSGFRLGAIASHVMGFWYGWGFAPGRTEEL